MCDFSTSQTKTGILFRSFLGFFLSLNIVLECFVNLNIGFATKLIARTAMIS